MHPPQAQTSLYHYRVRDGCVVGSKFTRTTLFPTTRLYSYLPLSGGSRLGSTRLSDIQALQYNLTTDGGCVAVPFTPHEHIRAAANEELRRYTFRRFQDGSITGEAWMSDEDALQFNLHSSKVVYAVPWVPPEQLSQLLQPPALTEEQALMPANV